MIYHATVNNVPYLAVSARNDDEARRRVIEWCRRESADGFCKRWKSCGMAVRAKSAENTVTFWRANIATGKMFYTPSS
jgi:hypothetical protein